MKTKLFRRFATTALTLCLASFAATSTARAVTWNVIILPADGGDVMWASSSPARGGVLAKTDCFTFDANAFIDLTFIEQPGWALERVMKNAEDITSWLDVANHVKFGPVTKTHTIIAKFTAKIPTGTFPLNFPTTKAGVTALYDVTGNYTGISPTKHARAYNVDVAMDENGKLAAMGTIAGHTPKSGGPMMGSLGKVTTVKGEATAAIDFTFEGTRDGVDGKARGKATMPLAFKDVGGGSLGVAGTGSYTGKLGGVPFHDAQVPAQFPATPAQRANFDKAWSISLAIAKKFDAKGKPFIAGNTQLTLPNGNVIVFAEKKLTYTVKNGYSVTLTRGMNTTLNPPAIDKKTSITIKKMTLSESGMTWVPSGGTLGYKFLGQKGTANLVDFLTP